jgi:dihydroflavonol-4-reductase
MVKRVLVTGITGYIGQHIAAELLTQQYEVVGTVRSLEKAQNTKAALSSLPGATNVVYVEADLLSDAGWENAIKECDYVIHVASPFILAEPKDETLMTTPAVQGTKRVINEAIKAGIKRVVLTSSVVSMTSGKPSGTYGPESWSDVTKNIGAYAKSKTLAERAAWESIQGSAMELVSINPGFVLGPSLGTAGEGTSETLIANLINGRMPAIPNIAMGMVDVRDIARLHVAALQAPHVSGKRLIASSSQPIPMSYLAEVLRKAGYSKAPSLKAPNFAIKIMALFDREVKGMVPNLGVKIAYDNHETFELLNWKPTPLEITFVEMAEAIST